MKCPEPPSFQRNSPEGTAILDYVSDIPEYLEYVTYTCPVGHMFEIYQDTPNEHGIYDLIEDIRSLNLTCADYGNWFPIELPKCRSKT